MAINGSRSDYPSSLDDWGTAHVNNQCERFRASLWNRIQDAVYALERHTRRVLLTGEAGSLRTDPGVDRPKLLAKTCLLTFGGGTTETKTGTLPAFTAEELAFLDEVPFAPEHNVQLEVRRLPDGTHTQRAFKAALQSPVQPDGVGQTVTIAPVRDAAGDTNYRVPEGTYVLSLLITR